MTVRTRQVVEEYRRQTLQTERELIMIREQYAAAQQLFANRYVPSTASRAFSTYCLQHLSTFVGTLKNMVIRVTTCRMHGMQEELLAVQTKYGNRCVSLSFVWFTYLCSNLQV